MMYENVFGQRNKSEVDVSLGSKVNTEEASKSKHHLWKRRKVLDKAPTTDDYKDSEIFDARFFQEKVVSLANTHAENDLKFKVLGCIDPSIWHDIVEEATLSAGTSISLDSSVTGAEKLGKPYAFLKVQVKSSTPSTPATVTAFMSGQK